MAKNPKVAADPGEAKIPRIMREPPSSTKMPKAVVPDAQSGLQQFPVWRFKHFDTQAPWVPCNTRVLDVLSKLRDYERMTWGEIERSKKRDHSCEVSGMSTVAQKRLRQIQFDDVDELFRFRLSGTQRIWGLRVGAEFYVIWWDPDHEVYPSHLK